MMFIKFIVSGILLSFPPTNIDFGYVFPGGGAENYFIGGPFVGTKAMFNFGKLELGPEINFISLRGKGRHSEVLSIYGGGVSLRLKPVKYMLFDLKYGITFLERQLRGKDESGIASYAGLDFLISFGGSKKLKFMLSVPYHVYFGEKKNLSLAGIKFGIYKK